MRESIDDKLKKLPATMQKALTLNFTLLELCDFESADVDRYMLYLSEKIIFYDFYEDWKKTTVVKAFSYNKESLDYFKENLDSVFLPAKKLFSDKKLDLEFSVQLADDFFNKYYYHIKHILHAYASYLKNEDIAKKAEKNIEDGLNLETILKKKNSYAQNNKLTKSGFNKNLTVVQKKLLNYLIYKSQNSNDVNVEDGSKIIHITTAELKNAGCGSNQTAVKQSLIKLMKDTVMYIEHGKSWGIYNVFRYIKRDEDYGSEINVAFSPEMTALVDRIGVSRNYTLLSINSVNQIKRYTSMRLYELCCQYRNSDSSMVYIDDKTLRIMLNCTDKYEDPHDFKKAILNVAQKDLQEMVQAGKLDLYFTFKEVKKSESCNMYGAKRKSVEQWAFVIHRGKNYVDKFIKHDEKTIRQKNAIKEIQDIISKYLDYDALTEYISIIGELPAEKLFALVQDIRFEVFFNKDNFGIETIKNLINNNKLREGESSN